MSDFDLQINETRKSPVLFIVVPAYNEEAVLSETAAVLARKLRQLMGSGSIDRASRVLFVNDGSRDHTWDIIAKLHAEDRIFAGISLSRNRGHQNALLAGLMTAAELADAAVSIDADLQDDVDAIDQMTADYRGGSEIVYGVRSDRTQDSFLKRFTAESFYRLMQALGADIIFNHADYRLMSARALRCLAEYKEVNLFLRGIVPLIGFKTSVVSYERRARQAGESKYTPAKMLSLAFDGVTSFSVKPIRMVSSLGLLLFLAALTALGWLLARRLCGACVSGLALLSASMWLLGGVQLMSLGLVGEYVGKIYSETKARPKYFIAARLL